MLHKNYRVPALAAALLALIVSLAARTVRAAPLEVYGRLPSAEDVALSPDGSRLAFVRTTANDRLLSIISLSDGKPIGTTLRVGTAKMRSVAWADSEHLIITLSRTGLPLGLMGRVHEWYMLDVFDLKTQKVHGYPDLAQANGARIMNAISGRLMVRQVGGHTVLFIPGIYVDAMTLPALFSVDLDTGVQKLLKSGSQDTLRWLVDGAGVVVAQENYDQRSQRWRLLKPGRPSAGSSLRARADRLSRAVGLRSGAGHPSHGDPRGRRSGVALALLAGWQLRTADGRARYPRGAYRGSGNPSHDRRRTHR